MHRLRLLVGFLIRIQEFRRVLSTNFVPVCNVGPTEASKLVGAFLFRPYLVEVFQIVPSRQPSRPSSTRNRVGQLPQMGSHGAKACSYLDTGEFGRLMPSLVKRLSCKLHHRHIEVVDRKRARSQTRAYIQCLDAIPAHR